MAEIAYLQSWKDTKTWRIISHGYFQINFILLTTIPCKIKKLSKFSQKLLLYIFIYWSKELLYFNRKREFSFHIWPSFFLSRNQAARWFPVSFWSTVKKIVWFNSIRYSILLLSLSNLFNKSLKMPNILSSFFFCFPLEKSWYKKDSKFCENKGELKQSKKQILLE